MPKDSLLFDENKPLPGGEPVALKKEQGQKEPEQSDPSIRTMKSDMDQLFAKGKPAVAQMAGRAGEHVPVVRKQAQRAGIYLVAGLILILFLLFGGAAYMLRGYWWKLAFGPQTPTSQATEPPAPFFTTESSRTVTVRGDNRTQFLLLMEDALAEVEREKSMKRIVIKVEDASGEKFADLEDVFSLYRIESPGLLLDRIGDPLMTFVFYGEDGSRLGFAAGVHDQDRAFRDLLFWEQTMVNDLAPIFGTKALTPLTSAFEDRTYRNIDWRFIKLSREKDLGIGYTIFPAGRVFILATSKTMMERVIDRMFDIR